jgi:hypothetical protein
VFCAGDAAYLLKDAVIEHTKGIGTGALSDSLPAVVSLGVPITYLVDRRSLAE